MSETSEGSVRIGMESRESIKIEGLRGKDADFVKAAMHGLQWIRVVNGTLIAAPATCPLPAPADDLEMLPFWRPYNPAESPRQAEFTLNDTAEKRKRLCASITILNLCGHYYTSERYQQEAERLESYGFECMRSRRRKDGRYLEVWYLPGMWAATGDLREVIDRVAPAKDLFKRNSFEVEAALAFLQRKCSFGSLDVTVQRLAMEAPE